MKPTSQVALYLTAASLVFALPAFSQSTNNMSSPQYSDTAYSSPTGQHEAMRMVRAQAMLKRALDADSVAPGFQFRAALDHTVHLDNGTDLPGGTVLLGRVDSDDMNLNGHTKLALRFTQAVLKNGQTIPIKATIVSAYKPGELLDNANDPDAPVPNEWSDNTLIVDQIGVSKDVNLHSRIASKNSGVFVSTRDHDFKLPAGSEFNLAIAASPAGAA